MSFFAWLFAVAYPLAAFAVLCAGAFTIGANRSRFRATAERRHGIMMDAQGLTVWYFIWAFVLAALISAAWPVSVPMYLAYRKGTFIDQRVAERDAEIIALNKRAAS